MIINPNDFSLCLLNVFIAGVTPHQDLESRVRFATPDRNRKQYTGTAKTANPPVTRLSFDDYFMTWSGIATSKPTIETPNPRKRKICNKMSTLYDIKNVSFEDKGY